MKQEIKKNQESEKTQINTLKRGHGNRGIIGSNHAQREEIGQKVLAENPETLKIEYKGRQYELKHQSSKSKKTHWYISAAQPIEVIQEILPTEPKLKEPENIMLTLYISGEMEAEWHIYHRKSENSKWRFCKPIEIEERDITIL